jgi:hypothetical protein
LGLKKRVIKSFIESCNKRKKDREEVCGVGGGGVGAVCGMKEKRI